MNSRPPKKKTPRSIADKERARKKGHAEALTRDFAVGQPRQRPSKGGPPPESHQTQTLQESGTSGNQTKGKEKLPKCGPSVNEPKLFKSKGPSQGNGKQQSWSRGHSRVWAGKEAQEE